MDFWYLLMKETTFLRTVDLKNWEYSFQENEEELYIQVSQQTYRVSPVSSSATKSPCDFGQIIKS